MTQQLERDERGRDAIAHWAPRFITNGVDYNDFMRVTAGVATWDEWLPAWVSRPPPAFFRGCTIQASSVTLLCCALPSIRLSSRLSSRCHLHR